MITKTIKLTPNEVWPLINILNEICYGIFVFDFEAVIGASKEVVVKLMDKISNVERREEETALSLNELEFFILKKAFEEVAKQIDEWEFPTRVGITKSEANAIKMKF